MSKGSIFGILIALIVIMLFPFFQIWGLNTLFDVGIGYGVAEWFGMVAVNSIFASGSAVNR